MFYKRLILVVVVGFLTLSSCVFDYEDNQRILITGQVRNSEGIGLENIPVIIRTNNGGLFRGSGSFGREKIETQEDGTFRLVVLKPKSFEEVSIRYNDLAEQNSNPRFRDAFVLIEATDIINNDLKLTPVTLEEVDAAGKSNK